MAEEKSKITLEAEVKSTSDPAGFKAAGKELEKLGSKADGAEKEAHELQVQMDTLAAQSEKLAKSFSAKARPQVAALAVQLDRLEKEAKQAGVALAGVGKTRGNFDKAIANVSDLGVKNAQLTDKIGGAVKAQTLQTDLFNDAAGPMGQYAQAAGLVGASFAGGFTIGLTLAKKAGIDLTEAQDKANAAMTASAKLIATLTTGPYVWLIEKFQTAGREVDNLLAPIENVNQALRNLQRERERGRTQDERATEAAKTLGIVTREAATASAVEFTQALRALSNGEAISSKEKEKLILRYRELRDQGASFTAEQMRLIASARLDVLTTAELAEAKKKAADETQRLFEFEAKLAEDQAKAGAEAIKRGEILATAATAAGDARRQAAADEAALAAENELRVLGAAEDRVLAYEMAIRRQMELQVLTDEEKLAAEIELQDQLATLRLESVSLEEAANEAEVAAYQAKIDEILQAALLSAEKRVEIERAASEEIKSQKAQETKWEKMDAKQKASYAIGGVSQALGAATAAFGEKKEVAIAQALINTYESATGAYNSLAAIPIVGPALGAAAAALAIVAGLKNVKEIKSKKKSSGVAKVAPAPSFDDPTNDAAARLAGQASARDLVNHHANAFRATLSSGRAGQLAGNTSPASAGGAGGLAGGGPTLVINGDVIGVPRAEFWKTAVRELASMDKGVEVRVRGNRSARVR